MFKPLLLVFIIISLVSVAATFPTKDEPVFKAKNLKVFPKNIIYYELDTIMDGFKAALGVKCNFSRFVKKPTLKNWTF